MDKEKYPSLKIIRTNMISLENAAKIHAELTNIFENGESKFLSKSTVYSKHQICQYMDILSSQFKSFEFSNLSAEDFIQSLKVDGEEVIGYKTVEYHRNSSDYYYNSLRNKAYTRNEFYVDTEKIINLATPAHFGKGTETVYDEEVRKALEIKADRIEITQKPHINKSSQTTYFDYKYNEAFQDIIPSGKKFVYNLYKMQIYQEGGKFERHKDTIHAPNHYATLVVSIPVKFTGGELCGGVAPPHDAILKSKEEVEVADEVEEVLENEDHNYLFKTNLSDYYEKSIIFLTDLDHEVKPVTSGTRIVLQYDVYLEDLFQEVDEKDELKEGKIENEETDDNENENESYENDYDEDNTECPYNRPTKEFLCDQKYIEDLILNIDEKILTSLRKFIEEKYVNEVCFLLSHKYPLSISKEYLKNGDLRLYEVLSKEYDLELGYVVNHYVSDYEDCYDETRMELKVMSYQDVQNFLQYCQGNESETNETKNLNETRRTGAEPRDETNNLNETRCTGSEPSIPIFVSSANFNCAVFQYYIEHTGNEAAPAEFSYVSVALCARGRVPPHDELE